MTTSIVIFIFRVKSIKRVRGSAKHYEVGLYDDRSSYDDVEDYNCTITGPILTYYISKWLSYQRLSKYLDILYIKMIVLSAAIEVATLFWPLEALLLSEDRIN